MKKRISFALGLIAKVEISFYDTRESREEKVKHNKKGARPEHKN